MIITTGYDKQGLLIHILQFPLTLDIRSSVSGGLQAQKDGKQTVKVQ